MQNVPHKKMERQRVSLNMPIWAYKEIKERARENKIAMSSIIIELLKITK